MCWASFVPDMPLQVLCGASFVPDVVLMGVCWVSFVPDMPLQVLCGASFVPDAPRGSCAGRVLYRWGLGGVVLGVLVSWPRRPMRPQQG